MQTSRPDPKSFRWDGDWAADAFRAASTTRWAHHGVAATSSGFILTMAASESRVLVLSPDGDLDKQFEIDVTAAHGLTSDVDGEDVLWVADNGQVSVPQADGQYLSEPPTGDVAGAVVKYSLDGEELLRLDTPPLPIYESAHYSPTHVAVDSVSAGGSGDVWVADGYGQNLVHRFDKHGRYLMTISGHEGAGPFARPHSVVVDRRRGDPELYVADRSNARLQVYDLNGAFLRAIGDLLSPGGFAVIGDHMYVSELDARVTVLDRDDRVIGTLSRSGNPSRERPGWPNQLGPDGRPVRPDLHDGLFSTPHGIAAGPDGCLYVTEWLIGGRLVRLVPE